MKNIKKSNIVSSFALGVLFLSCNNLQTGPHIKFGKNEIDFGKMKQNVHKTRVIKFTNTGDDTLRITQIQTTCGCTAAIVSSEIIPPGKRGNIKVTFGSSMYLGKITRSVKIHSNDPSNQIVTLTVKADVLPPTVNFYFFYIKNCADCNFVKTKIFAPLKRKYKLKIRSFEISSPRNYELLVKLEEHCNDIGNRIPIVVIEDSILGGKDEIEKRLESKIIDCLDFDCNLPELKTEKGTSKINKKGIQLVYFYNKEYIKCDRTAHELNYLENKYPGLSVKRFNVEDTDSKRLLESMCDSFGVPEQMKLVTPIVFVSDTFFIKEDIISKKPEEFIERFLSNGTMIPLKESEKPKRENSRIEINSIVLF